jgi:hypothetical protein
VPEQRLESLDILVGEWDMTTSLAPDGGPRARTTFEWLSGRQFLIQRWAVDHPAAPDGIAVIGFDAQRATLLHHYFDSRGVARVYEMSFADGIWTLQRLAAAPDFSQRFIGTVGDDAIDGRWESSTDGTTWSPDFTLTYSRVR